MAYWNAAALRMCSPPSPIRRWRARTGRGRSPLLRLTTYALRPVGPLGLALGAMGTLGSTTSISAVDGAPTNAAILNAAATQADSALEKYGVVPTLTLRLGFDLI